jgi:hypothetical protein
MRLIEPSWLCSMSLEVEVCMTWEMVADLAATYQYDSVTGAISFIDHEDASRAWHHLTTVTIRMDSDRFLQDSIMLSTCQ